MQDGSTAENTAEVSTTETASPDSKGNVIPNTPSDDEEASSNDTEDEDVVDDDALVQGTEGAAT